MQRAARAARLAQQGVHHGLVRRFGKSEQAENRANNDGAGDPGNDLATGYFYAYKCIYSVTTGCVRVTLGHDTTASGGDACPLPDDAVLAAASCLSACCGAGHRAVR